MITRDRWPGTLTVLGAVGLFLAAGLPVADRWLFPVIPGVLAVGLVAEAGDKGLTAIAMGAVVAFPYLFALHVVGEAILNRWWPGRLARTSQAIREGLLALWVIGGAFVLAGPAPVSWLAPARLACYVGSGFVVIGYVLLLRWWAPDSRVELLRRGRALSALLCTFWFTWWLVVESRVYPLSMLASILLSLMVLAGSLLDRRSPPGPDAPGRP